MTNKKNSADCSVKIIHLELTSSFNPSNELNSIIVISEKLYVTFQYLSNKGILRNTVRDNIRRNGKSKKLNWQTHSEFVNGTAIQFILYSSIPAKTINRHDFPDMSCLHQAYKKSLDIVKSDLQLVQQKKVSVWMKESYYNYSRTILYHYKQFDIRGADKSKQLSVTHALMHCAIAITQGKMAKVDVVYREYVKYKDSLFQPTHIKSFYRKLKECRDNGIYQTIVHSLTNKEGNNTKFSVFHEKLIRQAYKSPEFYNYGEIKKYVDLKCLDVGEAIISLSSIKAYLRRDDVKNECHYHRYGKNYADSNIFPFQTRMDPEFVGDIWMIDGTKVQFYYKDKRSLFHRLTFFVVLEIYSRKIIGYSFSESEDTVMVLKALEMASETSGHFPSEILKDNSPAVKNVEFKRFEEYLEGMGVFVRTARAYNAKDKAQVERLFGTFQTQFCKKEYGYLGSGVKSKRAESSPSFETLRELTKSKNIRTKQDLTKLLVRLIESYNNSPRHKSGQSPNKRFELGDRRNCRPFKKEMLPFLFWNKTTIKIKNSMITLEVSKQKHSYSLLSEEKMRLYNNVRVQVRYNPEDLSSIHIYSINSENFIDKISKDRPIQIAKVSQTADDRRLIQKRRGAIRKVEQIWKARDLEEKEYLAKRSSEYPKHNLRDAYPQDAKRIRRIESFTIRRKSRRDSER